MDATKRLSAGLHEIVQHSRALLEATGGQLDEQVKHARKALEDSLSSVKDSCDEYGDRIMNTCKGAAADADKLIKDKPYHVISGTFIAGLLLGWVLSRK